MEIGDIVKCKIWEFEGQIVKEYKNYWDIQNDKNTFVSRSTDDWLQEQTVPFTPKQINDENWFGVVVFNGGSIWSCESRLELLDKVHI